MNDLISRQWLVECVNEGWIKFDTEKDENRFIHLVRDIAPSAQTEQTTEMEKQDIIRIIEDGIVATSAKDVYSCGMRNGMRWCKALLDDKKPEYEDAQPETCEGCKHLDKYENEVEYGYPSPCTRCKRRVGDHYERRFN